MKNQCIINYSEGMWYPRGQIRLVESLFKIGYTGDVILLNWFLIEKYQREINIHTCPNHKQSPYAFKYWAFEYARKKGYRNILWLDSSFWAVQSLQGLFDEIASAGYVLQESDGYKLGNWCSDIALKILKYSRDKAFSMTMFDGGFIGLNMHDKRAISFLRQMITYSLDKTSFRGDWKNDKQQVSKDKRVLGHRHDMSVGTMVAKKSGMLLVPKGSYWIQKGQSLNYPNACLLGEGM